MAAQTGSNADIDRAVADLLMQVAVAASDTERTAALRSSIEELSSHACCARVPYGRCLRGPVGAPRQENYAINPDIETLFTKRENLDPEPVEA